MKRTRRTGRGICDFANVIEYIKHGKYPKDVSEGEKRSLRKRSKSFRLDGENLYYLTNQTESKGDVVSEKNDRLVLLTEEQRLEVIAEAHVDSTGVHLGREKATNLINKKYYWVGVSNMVREYARSCKVCCANRLAQSQAYELYRAQITHIAKEEDEFHDVETASSLSSSYLSTSSDVADDLVKSEWQTPLEPVAFGEVVELSVLGPHKCQNGSRYVVVFMDVYSGWPEAYVVDKVTPADITHLVINWICRFGMMQNVSIKNSGSCSMTECQPLTRILKDQGLFDIVIHQSSTVWNSTSQWNEVEDRLVSFIENNVCWDKCLEFALLPLRISRGRQAEYTPSYLTFGRELRLPLYLSHREGDTNTSATMDPHLTLNQMECSTDKLIQLYTEYAYEMGKEFKEQNKEVANRGDFKVPVSSNHSGKKRGRKRKELQQTDEDNEENENRGVDILMGDTVDSTEISPSATLPTGSRKRKPRHSQQLKDSKQIKTEKDMEAELDGDSEKSNQDMCKVSLDVFYRSILMYLEKKTYPAGSSEHLKRAVRKAHNHYSVDDGKLMYKVGSSIKREVITTLKGRLELLQAAHIDSEGNHMPVRHVERKLSQYYWRSIMADCQAFVAACPTCDQKRSEKKTNLTDAPTMARIRRYEKMADVAEKHYALLIQYLQKSKFPPSTTDNDKIAVEKIADHFKLVKGVLYLMDKSSSMCVEIASRARKMAIKSAHQSTGSTLPSYEELCGAVSQKYIWHGLSTDVFHYLNSLGSTAQECPVTKPSHIEKKRLEFIEYFNDEKAFFEKYEDQSVAQSTQDELEENNELTVQIGLDMDVFDCEEPSGNTANNQSEEQVTDKTMDKTESSVSDGADTEVGLNNYVSNNSNKVYVVSTTRNPAEAESEITVHITEETENSNKANKEELLLSEKEGVMKKKSQLSDLGEGGLVQLANALALVSDPLTEAAVQSIIQGVDSSQKVSVTPLKADTTKASKQTGKKTAASATSGHSQLPSTSVNPQDSTKPMADEETGDGKKKKTSCLFTCNICNQVIRGNVKFKIHMAKHNGQKPFQCDVCNKQFTNIKSRRMHMRKHTGVTPYLCNLCGKKFTLIGSLKAHIKIHEKGGCVKIVCKICDRVFASQNRYDRHMEFKHPSTPPVYKCDACSKFFTTARSLRRHTMSFHMNIKYHLCGVCGKSFFRKEYLTSHLAQHQGLSGVRKVTKKRESSLKAEPREEVVHVEHIGPSVVQRHVQQLPESATIVVDSSDIQDIQHADLQTLDQSDVQNIGSTVVRHVSSSDVTRPSPEALETYQATHIVAAGNVTTDNLAPVTLYSNSHMHYTDTGAPVENTYYTIETTSQDDEQQAAVVYGYPAVQYEVECSSGAEQLNSEDLSAINLLAQASVCQGNESITYVAHAYQ
ncbi:uncharacterized protein LOC132556298 [Ylistrum balloti]|uniref:uncharacterized protein LOC132556298 n=1 Tax=Ylistrum balloti TaxID=509963 RepID=UPI002905904C|nr:uncharacterized protein LOC132556298 [Ylistrum balloti]